MNTPLGDATPYVPWYKGKFIGQKAPLRISEV